MRHTVLNLEESMIRQVANAGMGRTDVLKFWFGESDQATPAFIRDAAIASLQQGETFYAHNPFRYTQLPAKSLTRKFEGNRWAGQALNLRR